MDLLQFLLSFFEKEVKGGNFEPIYNLFKNNSFNLRKTLSNLDISAVAPLIKDFVFNNKNASPKTTFGEANGLTPISNFADKQIVEKLNCYFSD